MTDINLRFYKVATLPTSGEIGGIYFNKTDKTINVYTSAGWESYAGSLKDASWDTSKSTLTITKYDGSQIALDFSDMASASAIATQLSGLNTRVETLETTVGDSDNGLVKEVADLRAEMNALGGVDGGDGIGGMIDAKINALDVTDTAAEGQYVASVSQEDGKITVTRAALPDYTEVYDAKGSASQALEDAKAYTDKERDTLSEKISANEKAIAGNTAAINSILGNEDETNLNSIAELAAWINEHGTQAEGFATAIGENKAAIEKEVEDRDAAITAAIEAEVSRADAAYATAAQGSKADTAVQTITTGTSNGTISVDGTNVPVYGLGSAAYTNSGDYDIAGAAITAETNAKSYADSLWVWAEFE